MNALAALGEAAFFAQGVECRYGPQMALANVDLVVPHGAVLLLVGANGAGKTTLLHLWLDLLAPSAGTLRSFGLDPARYGGVVRAQIGYVPETGEWPFGSMRLGRVLAHQAAYRVNWDRAYAERLCRMLDLRLDRRVRALSKGEFRRAQLVCALAHRPRALILDEPTDGLDPLIRSRVHELLAAHLADSPATVIVSTHQVHEMEGLTDRVAILHEGHVVDAMSRDDLLRSVRQLVIARPAVWQLPEELPVRIIRREPRGFEERWTIMGDVTHAEAMLQAAGARVIEARSLSLEAATIALLFAAGVTTPMEVA